ncbi:MAG: prolyl oligopeptidase family serine peptidase [Candidatus Didemnitutus sp.]|nr:prolyl oligopeptidase family serine peptidase [Candidatus Didemnitutus sp.]
MPYPTSKTVSQTDDFHGVKVDDPFRWLEDVDADDTKAWVGAQNQVTFDFLQKLPQREVIKQRLQELINYPRYGLPSKQGGRYFYSYNAGLQNQSPIYVKDTLDAAGRVIIDPNTLSTDGTVAVTTYVASDDGQWLGYGVAKAGSDWNEFRVRSLATGEDAADVVNWVKFSGLSWTKDSAGFFYSRYPEPRREGNQVFSDLANQKIYYHRLGTPQADDQLIYERPDQPKWGLGGGVTEDGRYLLISVWEGTDPRNRLYYLDLQDATAPRFDGEVVRLIDVVEADYSVIGNDGSTLFIRTDLDAPRSKIIAIDLANPDRANWVTLVPQAKDVIASASYIGGKFVVNYMQDAKNVLAVFARDGASLGTIELPGIGSVASFSGREDEPELFFNFTSFTYPTTNFRVDLATGKTELFQAPQVAFDPSVYETKQVFYTSKDGTRVPMFITHRKGIKLDGSNPTLLYAYGGFNISLTPSFSASNLAWLELGGIYAVANLRGGGEYGREWHLAGTKLQKQNVFDDFIAAGDYLVKEGFTSHAKLAIRGGSNGGLLVGAVVNQRPDLARVAFPAVGVMDMTRFQKFTIGWAWASDYGSADDSAEMAAYLKGYSPVHNVRAGVAYPAIMVTTADHDDRVHPGHSFKYAAALQAANPHNPSPLLIRIETNAGHGAGKPISKQIEETADIFAFALHFIGGPAN